MTWKTPWEARYWESRYARGETSGRGSHGAEAEWKLERIVRWARQVGVRSILDLGSGDGAVAFSLLRALPSVRYVGLDLSPTAVNRNVQRCRRYVDLLDRAMFLVADAAELPDEPDEFPGGRVFDLVLCLDVLHHVSTPRRAEAILAWLFRARRLAVLTYWTPKALDDPQVRSEHCFYNPFTPPSGWTVVLDEAVPGDPIKHLACLVRGRAG